MTAADVSRAPGVPEPELGHGGPFYPKEGASPADVVTAGIRPPLPDDPAAEGYWKEWMRRPMERQLGDIRWEAIFETTGGWMLAEQKSVAPFRVTSPEGNVTTFINYQEAMEYILAKERERR